jgi:hypothetical protein
MMVWCDVGVKITCLTATIEFPPLPFHTTLNTVPKASLPSTSPISKSSTEICKYCSLYEERREEEERGEEERGEEERGEEERGEEERGEEEKGEEEKGEEEEEERRRRKRGGGERRGGEGKWREEKREN